MINIIIDDREHGSGVAEHLENYSSEATVECRRMKTGDYLIQPGSVMVERKTVDDLCVSIIDGRLFRQCRFLVAASDCPLLLIEGNLQERTVAVEDTALRGALLCLAQIFHLPAIYSRGPRDTAAALVQLGRQRMNRTNYQHWRSGRCPKNLIRQKLHVLQALPGVGPGLARKMLECLGSVRSVFSASQEELQSIEGIGSRRAARISEVIGASGPPNRDLNP